MPATFAHCLLAREAMTRLGKYEIFPGVLKQNNHFVVMGATGPDYPYLTDVLKNQALHIGHNWANRMHYENTDACIREGVRVLSLMDKKGDPFKYRLAWFAGYVSHVVADSYIHPVVNSTVHGTYIFTHTEHGRCELVQDIYIFNKKTGTDICKAAVRDNSTFGYLNILDDCSDPENLDKMHPDISQFWADLLKVAHPNAYEFFDSIDPDTWHKNYKARVNFAANNQSIFRHVLDLAKAPRYVPLANILKEERTKYVDEVALPVGPKISYDDLFSMTVDKIIIIWKELFRSIQNGDKPSTTIVKDWNLDTGVDESKIDLWIEV
jgi:hypothetical protein